MNDTLASMFKGLMFLHGHFIRPDDLAETPRKQYGARTAAAEFGRPLGNRAASAAWFGRGGAPQSEHGNTDAAQPCRG